jgi:hypothetical protein
MINDDDRKKIKPKYLEAYKNGVFNPPKILDLATEMQLSVIGDFAPLKIKINLDQFKKEIEPYKDQWVPYLHREGSLNDRQGLNFVGLPGDTPQDSISMPEAQKRVGKKLTELDFDTPTQLYHDLKSLKPITEVFPVLGRCTLVKVNKGGWFPSHRDGVLLNRHAFRLVAFLTNTGHESYHWEHDYRIRSIEEGRCYFVDTRKQHRTHSYVHDSIHLVMNIPKTYENVLRVLDILQHGE